MMDYLKTYGPTVVATWAAVWFFRNVALISDKSGHNSTGY